MTDEKKKTGEGEKGVTRRQFITSMGTAAAVAAVSGRVTAAAEKEQAMLPAEKLSKITLLINGRRYRLVVEPRWSLLYVLRERIGPTGTKVGCERGECGTCTVLIDGLPRYACMTLAVEAEGSEITTVEGLLKGDELGPVQQAFAEEDAFQCGYCTPGQIMAAEGLLQVNHDPSLDEIRRAMSGNMCRCGSYAHIFKAVQRAAELKGGRRE
ncbi:MAG: (2Fe-2S)-binding protein [Syntrophorhabdales bacterium]|jgi:xanthine dehydrogenase YagT iron-sulfur-binding subunit